MIKPLISPHSGGVSEETDNLIAPSTISHPAPPVVLPEEEEGFLQQITRDPLNADLHFKFALEASEKGMPFLAYAELRTAAFLGADAEAIGRCASSFREALPDLQYMNHNQFFRFQTLANEILERGKESPVSILDIGGGQGELAAFLPGDFPYCLIEPTVNGISGTDLPFPDHTFDYVVSCHVLEHIPVSERKVFLGNLLLKCKQGVILLNPFHVEGTFVQERLSLLVDITNAPWAKEHMDCTLPMLSEIQDYAHERGLVFSVKPSGTMTTSLAFVFIDHFAAKSASFEEWHKLNAFFNQRYMGILDSAEYPTAYLIYFGWPTSELQVTVPKEVA